MEDFVPYELAKKLNDKGFTCEYPFAMYTKYEQFCPLYTSDEYFFRIDDFGKHNYIAPTISQVLKWLFDEKQLFINVNCNICDHFGLYFKVYKKCEETWEECATGDDYFYHPTEVIFAGIKYILDNLI